MVAAARKADRFLMEALMYRFHPRTKRIEEMIAEGAIGIPRLVRAARTYQPARCDLRSTKHAVTYEEASP